MQTIVDAILVEQKVPNAFSLQIEVAIVDMHQVIDFVMTIWIFQDELAKHQIGIRRLCLRDGMAIEIHRNMVIAIQECQIIALCFLRAK